MKKQKGSNSKLALHNRNKHIVDYDFKALSEINPNLINFLTKRPDGTTSINFKKSKAVMELNKALLKQDYKLDFWEIPENYLCPPIPGRADYIHYLADLLAELDKSKEIPSGDKITVLDIGTGSSCIYPIIGTLEYGWNFIGSDIDETALSSAQRIVDSNKALTDKISLRKQSNHQHFFKGIVKDDESIDISICNPPFHSSEKKADDATQRKNNNLNLEGDKSNFGGQANELWYQGGELAFIKKMIRESKEMQYRFLWFTSLVSKKDHLKSLINTLKKEEVVQYKVIEMAQGNKLSRILAWSFLSKQAMRDWRNALWME